MHQSPRSSREWLEHFRANEKPEVLPEGGPRLSEAVISSIQEFQLGESVGTCVGAEYAKESRDEEYLWAMEYFIREEQRHAGHLRDYLASESIGTVRKRWVYTVFRRLRNRAGLEVSVGVLLTAEIIAMVYHAALADAGPDLRAHPARRRAVAILRRDRPELGMKLTRLLHRRALFFGACLVVWRNHGKAIRRLGFPKLRSTRPCA
jgi:hypothetical protein